MSHDKTICRNPLFLFGLLFLFGIPSMPSFAQPGEVCGLGSLTRTIEFSPANGFPIEVGEAVTVTMSIHNASPVPQTRIRVDFLDDQLGAYGSSGLLGRFFMVEGVQYSHGHLMKPRARIGFRSGLTGSNPDMNGFTYWWVIDDLFRNGGLAAGETATIQFETIAIKPTDGPISFPLPIEQTGTGFECTEMDDVDVEIVQPSSTYYDTPVIFSTFNTASQCVLAGEPALFQTNILNTTNETIYLNFTDVMSKGLVPMNGQYSFYSRFYEPPGIGSASYNTFGYISWSHGMYRESTVMPEIENFEHYNELNYPYFAGYYAMESPGGEWRVTRGSSSFADIRLPPGVTTFWFYGMGSIEQNGAPISLNGTLQVMGLLNAPNTNGDIDAGQYAGSVPVGTVYTTGSQLEVCPIRFEKTVASVCTPEGREVEYTLHLSGLDLKKLPSDVLIRDVFPEGTVLEHATTNGVPSVDVSQFDLFSTPSFEHYLHPGPTADFLFRMLPWPGIFPPFQSIPPKSAAPLGAQVNSVPDILEFFRYQPEYVFHFRGKIPLSADDNRLIRNVATLYAYSREFDQYAPREKQVAMNSMYAADDFPGFTLIEDLNEFELLFPRMIFTYEQQAAAEFQATCAPQNELTGFKYEDRNANGQYDAGEPGLEGWTIRARSDDSTYTAVTGPDGRFQMRLFDGTYTVYEEMQPGWTQSDPGGQGNYQIRLSENSPNAEVRFGNWRSAEIYGIKYFDENGDGVRDVGEPTLSGVEIRLLNPTGSLVATTWTDEEGRYHFTGLKPGTYIVEEVIPPGYVQSQPADEQRYRYTVTLASGEVGGSFDFGNFRKASLRVLVFHDLNRDGVRDADEPPLPGWGVEAHAHAGRTALQYATNQDGLVVDEGVRPGDYAISADLPEYWLNTTAEEPVLAQVRFGSEAYVEIGRWKDSFSAPEELAGRIVGNVFFDADTSATWLYPMEPGVPRRLVTLIGTSQRGSEIHRSTSTDEKGCYMFEELPAGIYIVQLQATEEYSPSWPLGGIHVVELGVGEEIGECASGEPGGPGWLQKAAPGSDRTFTALTAALDLDLDGKADTHLNFSGMASLHLGGRKGENPRSFTVGGFYMHGLDRDGEPIFATSPGLVSGRGLMEGTGPLVEQSYGLGIQFEIGGMQHMSDLGVPYKGQADRWPVRYRPGMFTAKAEGYQPLELRNPFGTLASRLMYAWISPLYGVDFGVERVDFGDGPADYPVTRARLLSPFHVTPQGITHPFEGARHLLPFEGPSDLTLGQGSSPDLEGMPSPKAEADADDGVILPPTVAPGATLPTDVHVVGEGLLSIWADWNRDHTFDAAEQLLGDRAVSTGIHHFEFDVPAGLTEGNLVLRFRLTRDVGVRAIGPALDGEVEDWVVVVDPALVDENGVSTGGETLQPDTPMEFALGPNYPNPFNPVTIIPYELAFEGKVRLSVYDVTGREVTRLVDTVQASGRYNASFDAKGLPSGVYVVRLEAGGRVMTRKLTLLK